MQGNADTVTPCPVTQGVYHCCYREGHNLPHRFVPPETCEDRDYRCCDLTPPIPVLSEMTDGELEEWYERHVEAWYAYKDA